jgi:seryl-tRNA synthetase
MPNRNRPGWSRWMMTRRAVVSELQAAQERRNALSKEIGLAKRDKDEARAAGVDERRWRASRSRCRHGEERERSANEALELDAGLSALPNLPLDDVPVGADEDANVRACVAGHAALSLGFEARKEHFEIGEHAWT